MKVLVDPSVWSLQRKREYLSSFPAKFLIEKDRVFTENANRPHGYGLIDPENFSPFPKNPLISRFFREIGLAEELGSGVRNLYKYTRLYSSGMEPSLFEADIFKLEIPLKFSSTEQVTEQATEQANKIIEVNLFSKVLDFCQKPRTSREIKEFLGLKHREYFRSKILNPLLKEGLLQMTIPDKPTSPKQKYHAEKK